MTLSTDHQPPPPSRGIPSLGNSKFRIKNSDSGIALVVSLSIIVLITAVVLAFFARATSNRVIEASRSNRVEVEQLSLSAADYVTSQLLQEIADNSSGSSPNFQPTDAKYAVPQRPLPAAIFAPATNFANLVRRSVNEITNGVGETNASSHASATASRNGRSVGTSRWNSPVLLSDPGFNDTNQLPNWVYINADGSATNAPGTNTVGRFAYVVYDVGGLLDANVAGFPSSVASADVSKLKGTLAGADLDAILGSVAANTFVRWRNASNATSASSYIAGVTSAAGKGFLQASSGDNRLTSRQDLINLAKAGIYGITTNELPLLTHFTRELARPSLPGNGLMNMTNRYDLSLLASLASTSLTYTGNLTASNSLANPDLFQVLRSAIAYTNTWETNGPTNFFSVPAWAANTNLKSLAIGANVIDQFTTSAGTPTRILYGGDRVAGKKPLPLVAQVFLAYNIETNATGTNVYFSVIPQVWSAAGATATTNTITLSHGGGQLVIDAVTTSLPPATGNVTFTNTAGIVNASSNINPVLGGFLTATATCASTPTNISLSMTNLAVILSRTGTNYSSFGVCGDLVSATNSVANVTISTNATAGAPPALSPTNMAGVAIQAADPRTIRGAGAAVAFTNATAASLTSSFPTWSTTNYGGGVTDANTAAPTSRITSVGELGRVFRESPWRTMDFVTTNSPDKALLDVFSSYATPTNAAGLPVRAGVIDLNTRQSAVLAAMLSGTITTGSTPLTPANATRFATNMVAYTSTNSLTNRAQLVDLVANNKLADAADLQKEVREAAVRALGEVGQTRTWNLMFDIVAQAGSFPTAGPTTADSFRVQGEQRRWTHVAIDRPTAKVIDQTTEVSSE